jgi:hypothetical protein
VRSGLGDGPIWCAEGPKIRLSGIAAREIDESCRPGHHAPGLGRAAREPCSPDRNAPRAVKTRACDGVRAAAPLRVARFGKGERTAAACGHARRRSRSA